jgi:primosomal protein N'
MINGLDKRASFPYGASVGNHSIDDTSKKSHYKNISVTGTTFENTAVATNTTPTYYKHMAPVHYRYSPLDTAAQVNTLTASNNTYINVLDRGDSGIPDTLSGQNRPVYKLDLGLHKAWFRNAPVYLATVSNNFAKFNSHGSKYTKAVLASSVKKTTAKKTTKKKVAKKATKKAAAKKTTKKKAAKKTTAKKAAAKKTAKKKVAKKSTKKATKKTTKKKVAKKSTKKASSKKVSSKKKTAKKTTKKSSKKKSTKKKSTKKKTAKKSSKKSTKKTSKKK